MDPIVTTVIVWKSTTKSLNRFSKWIKSLKCRVYYTSAYRKRVRPFQSNDAYQPFKFISIKCQHVAFVRFDCQLKWAVLSFWVQLDGPENDMTLAIDLQRTKRHWLDYKVRAQNTRLPTLYPKLNHKLLVTCQYRRNGENKITNYASNFFVSVVAENEYL